MVGNYPNSEKVVIFAEKMKIRSIEDAISIIEESAVAQARATETGDYKVGNKHIDREMKALTYLYQQGHLSDLKTFLKHKDVGVRYFAAYALLPIYEDLSKAVLQEIANNYNNIHGSDAMTILKEWDKGNITYPYQEEWNRKNNETKTDNTEKDVSKVDEVTMTLTDDETALIQKLTSIFVPTGDPNQCSEENDFTAGYDPEEKIIQVKINTFVNPYTQDVPSVYKERLSRLDFLKSIATIDAYAPSKLGSMQITMTIPVADVTDEQLTRLRDIIFQMHSEQVPYESFVWFKSEYNEDVCYFEGNLWWCPRRAVIMGEDGYERYDFSDEGKFDMAMWNIVTGDYDQLEYSDSFELISSAAFQEIWDKTEKEHEPEPW